MKNDWRSSLEHHHFYFLLIRIVMGSRRVYAGSNLFVTYTNDDYTIDDLLESCEVAYRGVIEDILQEDGPLRDLVIEHGLHEEDAWLKTIKRDPEKHEELYLLVRGKRFEDGGEYSFIVLSVWPDIWSDNYSYQKYHVHFNEIHGHTFLKERLMKKLRNKIPSDRSKKLRQKRRVTNIPLNNLLFYS
jgi:hypothetical protein